MEIDDKSLTLTAFKPFLDVYTKDIDKSIATSQPIALVGAYGLGKGILYEYIQNLPKSKFIISYVDLELFTDLTPQKLFGAILFSLNKNIFRKGALPEISEDEFYWRLTNIINEIKNKKLVIVLRHVSKLLYIESKVIIKLNNFLFDNATKITLIGFSSPKIINYPSEDVNALFNNHFIFLKKLDNHTAINDIKVQEHFLKTRLEKYKENILRYSHNVHGTIVFLCSLLARYKPKAFNEHFIYQTIYNHPKLKMFFNESFDSLTPEQIDIIYNYCLVHKISKADERKPAFKRLVDFSIFYKDGHKSYKFIYEIFEGFIIRFVDISGKYKHMPENYSKISYELSKCKFLTKHELKIMHLLVKRKGEIATYNEIGVLLWDKADKFSIAAINKLISRIRLAILRDSNWKCNIVTKYKSGYYLSA